MLTTFPYSPTNPSLQLDYVPAPRPDAASPSSSSAPPFIFYVHGGGFLAGDRHTATAYMYGLAHSLNIPFVSVDYRLCPGASLEDGCADVIEAWDFVTAAKGQGGLSDKVAGGSVAFEAANGIVLGASAGSFHALNLLLHLASQSPPRPRPRALVNFYGGLHLDPNDLLTPKPLPHPLLDQPGGFAPLNAFVQAHFEETAPGKFKVKPQGQGEATGSHLSLLESLKANGFITDTQDFRDNIWAANGLSDELCTATQADKGMLEPGTTDFEPISRVLLLFWAIRNATLATCLDGPQGPAAPELHAARQQIHLLAGNDKISKETFPPTFTLHGTADVLVPHALSEAFHATLTSKGVESAFASAPEEVHTLDMRWIFGKSEKVGTVGGGGKPQELFEQWIAEKIHN